MNTQLWINDPTLLMNKNHIMELWPSPSMTTEQKINAITRLIITLSLLGYLITMSSKILMIGFITLAILIGLYYLQQNIQEKWLKPLIDTNNTDTSPTTSSVSSSKKIAFELMAAKRATKLKQKNLFILFS